MRIAVALPFLVACSSATDPSAPIPRSPARAPAAVLRCVAMVRNRPSVTCSRASITRRNLRADVIVGRKNYDVTLNFSGVTFTSGTGVFSAGVSVTNLMNQALGTTDGTTSSASGTRVFFTSGPSLAAGQGIITLSNPDGVGTFTASGQPYFQYATLIQPTATSSTRTWNFQLGDSVNAFAFTVEVDAPMPAEGSIRHWTTIRQGLQSNALTGMWQDTPTDIWAVGVGNTFLRNTGSGWAIVTPTGYTGSFDFQAIFGASSTDYWAVANGGHMVHYNGTTWASSTSLLTTRNLHGIWGASTTSYITVGDSLTIDQYNGILWTPMVPPLGVATATDLRGIWGNDGTHIFAVGKLVTSSSDHHAKLSFKIHSLRKFGPPNISSRLQQGRRRLKKYQRFSRDFIAEFCGMLPIIPSHTNNFRRANRRKQLGIAHSKMTNPFGRKIFHVAARSFGRRQ